jgi:O-antigen/teichoic acid export membrane protein
MAKVSVRGGFNLLWGLAASTIISSLGTIFTANLLGDTNYGLYAIALAAPNLISTRARASSPVAYSSKPS